MLTCPKCSTLWAHEHADGRTGRCANCNLWLVAFNPARFGSSRHGPLLLRSYNTVNGTVPGIRLHRGTLSLLVECPFCGVVHRHTCEPGFAERGPERLTALCTALEVSHWGYVPPLAPGAYDVSFVDGVPVAAAPALARAAG